MRHTRNRQMFKLTKHKFWKETYNLPMWEVRKWTKELDPTFKWHRDFEGWKENWVEFGGDETSYGELIKAKGKHINFKGWLR